MIYFAQAGEDGPIKIGLTKGSAQDRLRNLQTGSASPLRILGVCDGDAARESSLHDEFRAFRIRGEWFRSDPILIAAIGEIAEPIASLAVDEGAHPLRKYRAHRGLKLQDLANLVGLSSAALSRYENGRRRIKPVHIKKIAGATGISAAALRPDLAELFGAGEAAQ